VPTRRKRLCHSYVLRSKIRREFKTPMINYNPNTLNPVTLFLCCLVVAITFFFSGFSNKLYSQILPNYESHTSMMEHQIIKLRAQADSIEGKAGDFKAGADSLQNKLDTLKDNPTLLKSLEGYQYVLLKMYNDHMSQAEELKYKADSLTERTNLVAKRIFLPVRSLEDAQIFFGKSGLSTLQCIVVSGWIDRGSIYAELFSDYIWVFRLGLGTVFANAEEVHLGDTTGADMQRFFAGGGNVVFNSAVPLFCMQNSNYGGLFMYALPKFGLDLPVLGSTTDKITNNFDIGGEIHGILISIAQKFKFFGHIRAGYVIGSSNFYQMIGYNDKRPFGFGQWGVGCKLTSSLSISISGALFGPKPLTNKFGVMLNVSLIP